MSSYDRYFGSSVEERAENMATNEWQIRNIMNGRRARGPAFRALPPLLPQNNTHPLLKFDGERHRFLEKFTAIAPERYSRNTMYCISQHYELNYESFEPLYTLTFDEEIQQIKDKKPVNVKGCTCPYFENENGDCKHMRLFQILYERFQEDDDDYYSEDGSEEDEDEDEDGSEEDEDGGSEDEDGGSEEDDDGSEEDSSDDDGIASRVKKRREGTVASRVRGRRRGKRQ